MGAFLPLAIGSRLVGQDVAWLVQPYMALAALLALALWQLAGRGPTPGACGRWSPSSAAQSALLFGYYLWGGIKEVLAAALVATGSASPRRRCRAAGCDQRFPS